MGCWLVDGFGIPDHAHFCGRRMVITGRITSFFFVGGSLGGMFCLADRCLSSRWDHRWQWSPHG
jgi:hypothetical protein